MMADGEELIVAGMIEEIRSIVTKKGDAMAFIKLSDFNDTLETVVFPRVMSEFKNLLAKDKAVAVKGKVSMRNGEISLIVDKVRELV
jgi:DNA polymerase-3 subunit alpha